MSIKTDVTERGIGISYAIKGTMTPVAGSLIQGLLESLGNPTEATAEDLNMFSDRENDAVGSYEKKKAEAAIVASNIFSRIFDVSTTVVNPLVKEIHDIVTGNSGKYVVEDSLGFPKIVSLKPAKWLHEASVVERTAPYSNYAIGLKIEHTVNLEKMLNEYTDAELDERAEWGEVSALGLELKTGDNAITASETIQRVIDYISGRTSYNSITTIREEIGYAWSVLNAISNSEDEKDLALVEVPSYGNALSTARAVLSRRIITLRQNDAAALNDNKAIVVPSWYASSKDCIYVNADNYLFYVQNGGGSPEAILGMHLGKLPVTDLADPAKCVEVYERHLALKQDRIKVATVQHMYNTTNRTIFRYIQDSADRTQEEKDEAFARLAEAMRETRTDGRGVKEYALKVVCKTLIKGDNVRSFLSNVQQSLTEQAEAVGAENVDMEQAKRYASVRLIAKWIVDQVVVTGSK